MKKIILCILVSKVMISFTMDPHLENIVPMWGDFWPDVPTTPMLPEHKAHRWFIVAALMGDLERVKEYFPHVKNINEGIYVAGRNPPIWNALTAAIIGNHLEIVGFLIDQGVDINKKTDVQMPTIYTNLWGFKVPSIFFEMNKKLSNFYLTPLQLAEKLGYADIVNLLKNPSQKKPVIQIQPSVPKPLPQEKPVTCVLAPQPIASISSSSLISNLRDLNHALVQLHNVLEDIQ